jgi:hypothetical protein
MTGASHSRKDQTLPALALGREWVWLAKLNPIGPQSVP